MKKTTRLGLEKTEQNSSYRNEINTQGLNLHAFDTGVCIKKINKLSNFRSLQYVSETLSTHKPALTDFCSENCALSCFFESTSFPVSEVGD